MKISGSEIADGSVFFVAEAGVNHNGDRTRAKELVDAAAAAGADAVKFQTFSTDRLVAEDAPTADYQEDRTGEASQRDVLRRYELDRTDHEALRDYCERAGVTFLSTPFDAESAALLDDLDVAAVKIGSGDLTNHRLLGRVARLGRPMIASTGMATMAEVEAAYGAIRAANPDVAVSLLHCVSSYPADPTDANLRAMEALDDRFPVPVGYSDHTTAVETPGFAVAAGARIVEKHFTLDRSLPGPDHEASLEPDELARAVDLARAAAATRGTPEKEPVDAELETRTVSRKSLHAARSIERGETITADALAVLRPAEGLSPSAFDAVVGANASAALDRHDPVTADVVGTQSGRLE